jgi:hypothetical protein
MECLPTETFDELIARFIKSREFQFTHNSLVADIKVLHEALKLADAQQKPILTRALYKEFFSMIEADLYLINQFNPCDGYADKDPFNAKFKKTYRKHAADFKKADLHKKYQSAEFRHFLAVVDRRHHFTHPKGRPSLKVASDDLSKLEQVFETYRLHINALMTGVGFEICLPASATEQDAQQLIARLNAEDARLNSIGS